MTHVFSTLFLPFSMTLDNFPIGVAFGVKGARMKNAAILLITLVPAIGTFLGMVAGRYAEYGLPPAAANWLGSAMFMAIGVWTIWDTLRSKKHAHLPEAFSPALAQHTLDGESPVHLRHVNMKESMVVALALSVNNLGGGLGAGISGLNLTIVVGLTCLFGFLALIVGYRLGAIFKPALEGKWPGLCSGLVMLGLGVYELFV